jgi:hypothetical protein
LTFRFLNAVLDDGCRYEANSKNNALIPNSLTNTWPVSASWKKFLIRMSVEQGLGMIFPNLPHNMTMSTNHLEPGTNDKGAGASALNAKTQYTLPLMTYYDTAEAVSVFPLVIFLLWRSQCHSRWASVELCDSVHRRGAQSRRQLGPDHGIN